MSTPSTLVADRYRLVKMIGAGGMGVVWEAWDERLHRAVALKMLRTRPELTDEEREAATRRAMREARLNAGLHHPHAVPVFDVVEHEGQPCIVMQLIDSTPLSTLLREHGTFAPREAARVGAQVGSALAAAHHRRIVHRDVKPANILIREDGSAMISDFGVAYALGDANITATGLMYGTPAYLAPEVARGEPSSFASDVFSLGSTLFAMLEGAPPFGTDANAIALLHRVASGDLPMPTRAGPLKPLLLDMLSPEPKHRPDMKHVVSELTALERELEPGPVEEGTGEGRAESDGSASTIPIAGAAAGAAAAAASTMPPDADATAPTERLDEPPPELVPEPVREQELQRRPQQPDPSEPTGPTERMPATPLFPWMADSPPVDEPPAVTEPDAPARRRRRTAVLIGALVAVALLSLGAVLLFSSLRPDGGTATGPGAEPTETTPETSAPATTTPGPSPETPASTAPATPPPTTEAPDAPSGPDRAVRMLTDYYSLVPGDLDTAWTMMTEDYQVNHVGGRDAYDAFWSDVAAVSISDVSASAPEQAQATLTYTFADGRVVQEVTAYRLVDEGGVLKIAATTVLSSTQV
ncbi:serine/threonine-protein kinase [Agromyces sp. NPDC056523]|uniref:serine/threonine-protein kinase n=1 Tax=Agromyces sp. NPDC056523 TaxID=3345850 RepID=UPI00366C4124